MRTCLCLSLLTLVLVGCNAPSASSPPAATTGAVPKPTIRGEASGQPTRRAPAASPTGAVPSAGLIPGDRPDTYWVVNPSSGVRLAVRVYFPPGGAQPDSVAVLLVPGGTGITKVELAERLARQGVVAIAFDPDGRGMSGGAEDYGGSVQQDGLAAVAQAALSIPGVNATRYGLASYSYGITMASGALSRYPGLPLAFLIDWEGPADRNSTTVGCKLEGLEITWQPCEDGVFWSEREAVTFIGQIRVPYQRLQSQSDHVQPTNAHAVDMVNAAVEGGVPWVRLNDYPPGRTYDPADPPAMFPDSADKAVEEKVAAYAEEILVMLGR